MAMASECTSPSPSDGVTEEKEGVGLFSKIVNCVVELCYEPAKELCVSVPYVYAVSVKVSYCVDWREALMYGVSKQLILARYPRFGAVSMECIIYDVVTRM